MTKFLPDYFSTENCLNHGLRVHFNVLGMLAVGGGGLPVVSMGVLGVLKVAPMLLLILIIPIMRMIPASSLLSVCHVVGTLFCAFPILF